MYDVTTCDREHGWGSTRLQHFTSVKLNVCRVGVYYNNMSVTAPRTHLACFQRISGCFRHSLVDSNSMPMTRVHHTCIVRTCTCANTWSIAQTYRHRSARIVSSWMSPSEWKKWPAVNIHSSVQSARVMNLTL